MPTFSQETAARLRERDAAAARRNIATAHASIGDLSATALSLPAALDRIGAQIRAMTWHIERPGGGPDSQGITETHAALADAREAAQLLGDYLTRAYEAFAPVAGADGRPEQTDPGRSA